MNSSDMATYEDELEDMGVLVMSDECDAIEQFVTFFKYCNSNINLDCNSF